MENMTFNKAVKNDVFKIDPRAIVVEDGFNSRTDFGDLESLSRQIEADGVLNPITVIKFTDEDGNERYRLVDGERRYRATMMAIERGVDIARIPALFLGKNTTKEDLLVQQLMRNEGKPFSEYEFGIAYQKFITFGYTRKEIATKLCKPNWHVDVCLAHLERDERVQKLLRENKIEGATVRKIYQANNKDEKAAVEEILKAAEMLENGTETANPKKKITLKDLENSSSKTIAVKDTAAIKKGLGLFLDYIKKYSQNGENEFEIDITDIYETLKNDNKTTIVDVFDGLVKKYRNAE